MNVSYPWHCMFYGNVTLAYLMVYIMRVCQVYVEQTQLLQTRHTHSVNASCSYEVQEDRRYCLYTYKWFMFISNVALL